MIQINKGLEPKEWSAKKATPGFTEFEPIPELRDALLEEQGFICAYCMRRIPTNDINSDATSKIEHIKSQDDRPDLQLYYSNMAICCPGNMNNEPHCDTLKGPRSVNFNLHSTALSRSISYSSKNGKIKSNNPAWDDEMDKFLNLNHPFLQLNRRDALAGVIQAIDSEDWDSAFIRRKFREWSELDTQGKLKEYCGIVIWYLQRKLRQYP